MGEVTKIERAISKKELKNQEDVTDVVISEMIHDIQDKIEEVEKKVKSNHEKIKNIYPKAKEEFDKHVSTSYETIKKDFKEKFLDPLGIENTCLSVTSQSGKDQGYFLKETGMIIFQLCRLS